MWVESNREGGAGEVGLPGCNGKSARGLRSGSSPDSSTYWSRELGAGHLQETEAYL